MFESLDTTNIDTLRRLAVDAWQRAEKLEAEKAKAVEAEAKAVHEKKVVQAKLDAVLSENEVLLSRIAQLTVEIARATQRDTQLALELELTQLRTQLANSNDQIYGSRTERRPKDKPAKVKQEQKGHGPKSQPKLPLQEVLCELEAGCACKGCGADLRLLAQQFEESELISSVRRSFVLKEVKRQKYACGGCGTLCAAPGPLRLIPGGRYDIPFVVQVALDKYLDAMPLERQVRKMGRVGLDVTSQTLWDQLHVLYLLLLPSFLALQARVRTEEVLHIDETRWRMMRGKGKSKTWWLWVLSGAAGVIFDLQPTRGSDACKALIDGFAGVLVADGYAVYSSLEKAFSHYGEQLALDGNTLPQPDFVLAMCWMHARRGFFKAQKKGAIEADEALDLIGEIYAVEALAKERAGGDPEALIEHRRQLRAERSRALVTKLEVWCATQRVLPKTQLDQAIQFVKARWPSLKVFLEDPRVPLDNGEAERQIRGPVVGRKNYYGTRSEKGARVASLLFSLIQTCTLLNVDPYAYMIEAATRARRLPGTVYLPHEHPTNSSQDSAVA